MMYNISNRFDHGLDMLVGSRITTDIHVSWLGGKSNAHSVSVLMKGVFLSEAASWLP